MKDLFPYEKIRESQSDVIESVSRCVEDGKNIVLHAPTGIGKTAAALAPCLSYALEHGKTVLFLTARQTQHERAIETVRDISTKHGIKIPCADIIGKMDMCLQKNANLLSASEFREFCKSLVEEKTCEYYNGCRDKGKATVKAERALGLLMESNPNHISGVIDACRHENLCPYEISSMIAEKANVIVADYYYMFNPAIRNVFLQKSRKGMKDCIVIVDEAHNLGKRCRDLMTARLTRYAVERSISEAEKFGFGKENLLELNRVLEKLYFMTEENSNECIISKSDLTRPLSSAIGDYDKFSEELISAGDEIRKSQRMSFVGSIGAFLEQWKGDDEGFTRIYSAEESEKGVHYSLAYRALDPSDITREVFGNVHSSIIMSGTLTPTSFYKDILGVSNAEEREFRNPFPKKNRLNLIIPETTTKFTRRNEDEFKSIAYVCSKIVARVPGNSAIFFPSYYVRDSVYQYLHRLTNKPLVKEIQGQSKEEKEMLLGKFKGLKEKGAVLLGASTGSFGEGIDLPGDYLKCVIVVGLPLEKPDIETRESIRYYEEKFGKGWEYGYVFPAITKCMQNAGRCIRSENDKGVIVFLDERYAWENYLKCFPKEWDMQITGLYEKRIDEFFNGSA